MTKIIVEYTCPLCGEVTQHEIEPDTGIHACACADETCDAIGYIGLYTYVPDDPQIAEVPCNE